MKPRRDELTAAIERADPSGTGADAVADAILAAWPQPGTTSPANLDEAIEHAEILAAELGKLLAFIGAADPVPTRPVRSTAPPAHDPLDVNGTTGRPEPGRPHESTICWCRRGAHTDQSRRNANRRAGVHEAGRCWCAQTHTPAGAAELSPLRRS